MFIDADLTEWGTHFVTGLLGPLLADPAPSSSCEGSTTGVLDDGRAGQRTEGGRVTELVAKPLLAPRWPALSAVVQPLAGEWAVRRRPFERLGRAVGYGVELGRWSTPTGAAGLDAIAQVDLGERAHRISTSTTWA